MLNKVILMGRLTRDPELRHTQTNTPVVSFSLAVDRGFVRQGEERQADFIDIVAWRSTAEFVSRYFKKGQLVAVTGRLQSRKWQDNQGNNRISFEVIANEVFFAEGKRGSDGYDSQPAAQNFSNPDSSPADSKQAPSAAYEAYTDDDELPF